ncbi:MAG: choice-of-anchor Q domain-containing protein [Candidatus Omnitrophota bacterium]
MIKKSIKAWIISAVIVIFFTGGMTSTLLADTHTVSNTNDSGAGSLRQAISDTTAGDTIDFSVTGTITLSSSELSISKNLTITGPGADTLAISGGNSVRVFNISGGTVSVSGLTIKNGSVTSTGGGNSYGAGLYITGGTVTIDSCIIGWNKARSNGAEGAGLYIGAAATVQIAKSTIINNQSEIVGAVSNYGTLTMTNCTVSGNKGLLITDGGADGMSGGYGAINTISGTLTLVNVTITNNESSYSGEAGLGIYGGDCIMFNSILVGNNSNALDGSPDDLMVSGGTLTSSYNLVGEASGFVAGTGDQAGVTTGSLKLNVLDTTCSLGGKTPYHSLQNGSPAINAGTAAGAPATDQRGYSRSGATDIGAFEYGGAAPVVAPTVTTQAAGDLNPTSATGNGNITATGGSNATSRGLIYYTYTDTDKVIGDAGVTQVSENGSFGTGAFTASFTPLSVNIQYNARAYAINSAGTGYGSRVSFWTLANTPTAPTVNNATSSTLDVAVNVNGNPAATEFCIQETGTGKYVQSDGTLGVAAVWQIAANWGTKTVTGLSAGTTYTFQVKARNGGSTETAYGATASGTPVGAPTVTTQAAGDLTATSATGNGNITATNGANATTRGVIYYAYTNTDKIIGDAGVTDISENGNFGTGAFTASFTPLSVNTQYNARAYAISANGTGYGTRVAFWTLANGPTAPTVNNATATTLDVAVNVNANPAGTEFCIQETGTGKYVQSDGTLGVAEVWQTATNWGTKTVVGLTTGSTYTFQVKARNGGSAETAYGATASGTPVSAPTVTTQAAGDLTANSATGNGTIAATNGANATTRGVIYYTYTNTDKAIGDAGVTNVSSAGDFGTGAFTASLTSLSVNTQYNARAYATSTYGTGYGARVAFWTLANAPAAPTVNNPTLTTLDVAVNVNGNPAITEFCIQETSTGKYVQSDGSLGVAEVWQTATNWGTKTVTGLTTASTYTFQVKARDGGGTETAYGATASGVPVAAPTVSTQAASGISATAATGNGTIDATNGANATTRGVIYYAYTNTDKAIGDAGVTNVSNAGDFGTGAFTASLTSLSINTQYNARAHATSANGTGYGARVSFWTLANVPAAPTVNNATSTTLDITININSNPASTEFAIQETGSGNYVQANGTLGAAAVWQNAATWGTKTVTGLTTGSTYTFQVKARNGESTETAFSSTTSGVPVAAPTVTTQPASGISATAATGNGNITATNGGNATARGVIYYAYTNTDKAIGDAGVTNVSNAGDFGTGDFTASLTSLSINTQYNARAHATSANGTGYGSRVAFWTLANVPSAPTVNNATSTTLDITVNINSNPASTEFAIQETGGGKYVQADGTLGAAAVWQNVATWGTKTVTGLTTGDTYTFQVKARNGESTETAFGATTSGVPVAAPTVTTQAAGSITATTATGNGTITATNGGNATARGVIYYAYTNTDKAIGDGGVTNISSNGDFGTGAFTASLTPLSVNTQYNARAHATSANGTGYGSRVSFWTLANVPAAPTVNNPTMTTLDVTINVNGNPAITEFCIQETGTGKYVQADGSLGAAAVWQNVATWGTKAVTGLTSGSTYTFQVKARNGDSTETAFGATASGIPNAAPTVTTNAASSLTSSGATLNGTVNANNLSTTVTFQYGLTVSYGPPVPATQSPVTGTTNTAVSKAITGLTPNTVYHYRVVGVNAMGTTNGLDQTFTTAGAAPIVTTGTAGSLTPNSAALSGTVNANNQSTVVTFEYGTTTAYGSTATADQSPVTGLSDSSVSKTVSGLIPNTLYHFRVKGVNATGTTYGSDQTFTSSAAVPIVTTNVANHIGSNTATLNGTVNPRNQSTTVTFIYGETVACDKTVTASQSPLTGATPTPVSANISGLKANTTYYFKAKGVNATGNNDGSILSFTTTEVGAPIVTTDAASAITPIGATLNATINANNQSTAVTFEYGLTTGYGTTVTANPSPVSGINDTTVSKTITGLTPHTVYHYRAKGVNATATTYGADLTFTTGVRVPTVTTTNASLIDTTSATLGGNVVDDGGGTVSERGVCYSTVSNPSITDTKVSIGTGTGAFSKSITNLTDYTTYYVRAYATNATGTAYGNEISFQTNAIPVTPSITSPANGGTVSNVIKIKADITPTTSVSKVEFLVDDVIVATVTTTPPCQTSWDTNAVTNGSHVIKVIAYNKANTPFETQITVTVKNVDEISIDHSQLNYGATETSGQQGFNDMPVSTSAAATSAQTIRINNGTTGRVQWTASSSDGWLICSPTSGTGTGTITVSINAAGLSAGTHSGTITILAPKASTPTITIPVSLKVYASGGTMPPIGSFDNPSDGSTVQSNVPVTGWALDDIEIHSVKIYRAPIDGEGSNPIFIGNAVRVSETRPDIETLHPDYPLSYKSGWGYMLLTNFLPNSGNGTFTLYAKATDKEGNEVILGTKTITASNASAVKPFGTIDTPAQGDTISGREYVVFGWALTPLPNTIPTDGSTISILLDGVKIGQPVYNQYREDIATAFPGLNNSNGAVGYFYFDTTQYENGAHTIAWQVTDNAGNTDGLGSRYFNILNSDSSGSAGIGQAKTSNPSGLEEALVSSAPVFVFKTIAMTVLMNTSDNVYYPDAEGEIVVDLKECEAVEIRLNENPDMPSVGYYGYMDVNGQFRPLPTGSTLSSTTGIFNWQPGPGCFGEYRLVFGIRTAEGQLTKKIIKIKINPAN